MAGEGEIANGSMTGGPEIGAPVSASALRLFLLFSYIGLSSFGGGVPAWMHNAFVQRRGWIDEQEFSAMLAVARMVPGVNVVNLAVLIGTRLKGCHGALAAVTGLLIGPTLIAVGMAFLYGRFGDAALVPVLLSGTAAAAVGLLVAMGLSSIVRAPGPTRRPRARNKPSMSALIFCAATFVLVGVLRLPTIPTVLCLTPMSIALMFLPRRSSGGGE